MGDRGNIVVQVEPGDHGRVFLYGHWSGAAIPGILQEALGKRWRWDDPSYLTRIIFDVMTEGQHGGETGFGIATYFPDNEYDVLVVDPEHSKVHLHRYDWDQEHGHRVDFNKPVHSWSFEEFIALSDISWTGIENSIPEHLRVFEDL